MKYELWHVRDGDADVYTLLPSGASHDQALLESSARVIWSVEARTWDDARQRQHEFLGWEPYKPAAEG